MLHILAFNMKHILYPCTNPFSEETVEPIGRKLSVTRLKRVV